MRACICNKNLDTVGGNEMLFKRTDQLKVGMRLARPIYNRNGILLYERNSRLTHQGIVSIKNFGLIGIYILEPAEPVPPMTQDDIEFERFQTVSFFTLRDELKAMQNKKESRKLMMLANSIIKSYGNLYHKINFTQNLRSQEDYTYKHTLNVAILCALMSHQLDFPFEEQLDVVMAALLHDIHKLSVSSELADKKIQQLNDDELLEMRKAYTDTQDWFQYDTNISSGMRLMVNQMHHSLVSNNPLDEENILRGTKVLQVAEIYDTMTAMKSYTEPTSEVTAIRYLINNPKQNEPEIVASLIDSLHILAPGTCVTLTNYDKAIVISENNENVLRPVVLSFRKNKLYDLSKKTTFNKLQILDIMKTLDNRVIIDKEAIANFKGNPPPEVEE